MRQKKLNQRTNRPQRFEGYCMICNEMIPSFFDWFDHLLKKSHTAQVSECDNEVAYRSLDLHIFGNKSIISSIIAE